MQTLLCFYDKPDQHGAHGSWSRFSVPFAFEAMSAFRDRFSPANGRSHPCQVFCANTCSTEPTTAILPITACTWQSCCPMRYHQSSEVRTLRFLDFWWAAVLSHLSLQGSHTLKFGQTASFSLVQQLQARLISSFACIRTELDDGTDGFYITLPHCNRVSCRPIAEARSLIPFRSTDMPSVAVGTA